MSDLATLRAAVRRLRDADAAFTAWIQSDADTEGDADSVGRELRASIDQLIALADAAAPFTQQLPAYAAIVPRPDAITDGLFAVTKIIRLLNAPIADDTPDDRPLMSYADQTVTVGDARAALRAVDDAPEASRDALDDDMDALRDALSGLLMASGLTDECENPSEWWRQQRDGMTALCWSDGGDGWRPAIVYARWRGPAHPENPTLQVHLPPATQNWKLAVMSSAFAAAVLDQVWDDASKWQTLRAAESRRIAEPRDGDDDDGD